MEIVNDLKRGAFKQYQRSYNTQIKTIEEQRKKLQNELDYIQIDVEKMVRENELLENELNQIDQNTQIQLVMKLDNLEREYDSNKKMIEQFDKSQSSKSYEDKISSQQSLLEHMQIEY